MELSNSSSLFSASKLILVKPVKGKDIEFSLNDLKKISKDDNQNIIIDASEITQKAKLLERFKGYAVIKEFKKKADYSSFNIADALIIDGNAKQALSILNTITDIDNAIYGIIGAIQYNLRGVISLRSQNKISKGLKPFVKQKFTRCKLSNDEVKSLYRELVVLDAKCKDYKHKKNTRDIFMDFVINNFIK